MGRLRQKCSQAGKSKCTRVTRCTQEIFIVKLPVRDASGVEKPFSGTAGKPRIADSPNKTCVCVSRLKLRIDWPKIISGRIGSFFEQMSNELAFLSQMRLKAFLDGGAGICSSCFASAHAFSG
jgi:hypothetical protein